MHLKFFWRRFEIIFLRKFEIMCLLSCYKTISEYGAFNVLRPIFFNFLKLGCFVNKKIGFKPRHATCCTCFWGFVQIEMRSLPFDSLFWISSTFLGPPNSTLLPFFHNSRINKKVGILMSQFRIPHAKWTLAKKKSNFLANY